MDILAYGKAGNTLRAVKELNEAIIGKQAEGPHLTVDGRIDWLEDQTSKLTATINKEVNLTSGIFNQTMVDNQILQLEKRTDTHYRFSGAWESDVIDLGANWLETKDIKIRKGEK